MRIVIAATALALCGCATIVEGTSQEIYVSLTPEAASCDAYRVVTRRGTLTTPAPPPTYELVGAYAPATKSVMVKKSRYDLVLRCRAPGYRDKEVRLVSEASGWGVAGALTLDFGLIDYATGALNKYDASIQVVLEPL